MRKIPKQRPLLDLIEAREILPLPALSDVVKITQAWTITQRRMAKASSDYASALALVCEDICRHVSALSYVDMSKVGIILKQSRSRYIATMGNTYWAERLLPKCGNEWRYVMSVHVPCFYTRSDNQKLHTLIHELWHISPAFDGQNRIFPGRYRNHGNSLAEYKKVCDEMLDCYLKQRPPSEVLKWLAPVRLTPNP